MAEGRDAVDSGKKIVCNICEDAGSNGPYFYCVSCEQYLCEECKRHHSRVKATRSHEVIGADEKPRITSQSLGSDSVETPICADHKLPITHFCVDHMTELCHLCRLVEHKTCSNKINLGSAVKSVFTPEHSKQMRKSKSFSKLKGNTQSNKDKLKESKQSAINNVTQARKVVDTHLNNIEAAAYREIEKKFKTEMKQIEDQLHAYDVILSELQKRLSKLETAMSLGDKDSEFLTINSVTKEIKQQCNLLQNSIADTCYIDFTFRNSDSIDKLSKLLPNLGSVSMTKSPAFQSDAGTVAIYTGELKVRTATDTKYPNITSYEMLPDGRHIIVDQKNNKLKLYDSNNQLLSELVLPDMPQSIVLLNDTEAVVSLLDIDSLQFVTVGTNLTLSKTKKMNYTPRGMVKYGDDILATVRRAEVWEVVVIDNQGIVKRTIYRDNNALFSRPYYIGLSIDHKTVYVVDSDNGCIGLSMDDSVVFHYQDHKVILYGGLAVGRDCVFIGVAQDKADKVRRFSCSGDYMEDLDLGGWSWPLKMMGNNLIIYIYDHREFRIQFFYLL